MKRQINLSDYDISSVVDPDIGSSSDGMIYGNTFDFGYFREQNWEQILYDVGYLNLPFGKTVSLNELNVFREDLHELDWDVIFDDYLKVDPNSEDEVDDFKEELLNFVFNDNQLAVLELIEQIRDEEIYLFPTEGDLYDVIKEGLSAIGLPNGIVFEGDSDFPDEYSYWNADESMATVYEIEDTPFVAPVLMTIDDLKRKFNSTTDSMIKKSLLLSTFSVAESNYTTYLHHLAFAGQQLTGGALHQILAGTIEKMLSSKDSRASLFKKFKGSKGPEEPYPDLRNTLAHDIQAPILIGENIQYEYKRQSVTVSVTDVFSKIETFIKLVETL